ncbi:cytochrome P450 [Plantactinospora endophytica]|uniref:Fatty-acid peroxygenase n=1 Tax=Plantactinospora endophytica TaxID=673535 RepID=A0ABQ4E3M0_9ACTN|nr:cytochrome P450 [Plantactinospora endophytica]GIG89291.1 fatty-acid peroxygenase [Plantactinospora endophytica]
MPPRPGLLADNTLRLAVEGYGWLPNLRRREGTEVVQTRLLGGRAVALCGPEAARFFYDEQHLRRHGAVPGAVQATLFGRGAVHTLDGAAHRHRKAVFTSLLDPEGITNLQRYATAAWDETVAGWPSWQPVVLFDEVSRVLARAVCRWVGVPLAEPDVAPVAADMVAMVDGFGTFGPRHLRARQARSRRERWLAELVDEVRQGRRAADSGSAVDLIAGYRDADGERLDPRLAAVEIINLVRPTVAVCWYVAFAAHALHRWPDLRARLRSGSPDYVTAFGHEVRRFYPFAPFVAGRAVRDLAWRDVPIPAGTLVLLDLYGQNHDPDLWPDPYVFDPERFLGREIGAFELVPQGGGDPRTGHRCPGETTTVALLGALSGRLAELDYEVPEQDLGISLRRVPTRPRSGFVLVRG